MTVDIDPERKFSNGSDWNNSIDWDDASDGSDGGYNIHGSPINAEAMKELIQLRMTNARLQKDKENLREALKPFAEYVHLLDDPSIDPDDTIICGFWGRVLTAGDIRKAANVISETGR